jgi:hypothetical protein
MKYALLIYSDETRWDSISTEDKQKMYEQHSAFGQEMAKAGVIRGGAELKPVTTATTLRFVDGKSATTLDGPFAETKEQLGGFYMIDVENLEQALEWAAKMPMATGSVEVRPAGVDAAS